MQRIEYEMSSKYIARSSKIAARQLGDEVMIMSALDSKFFTLNPVAAVLWQAADGCTALDQIVEQRVCTEFEVASEDAMRDAEEFVAELAQHGILLVSDQPIPTNAAGYAENSHAETSYAETSHAESGLTQ